jgi:lipopolysaccharide transport system ATP-binding protein
MSSVVIRSEVLGKSYHRGAVRQDALLRDQVDRILKSPLSVFRRQKEEAFWALQDASFEVREGEVLGIIGRNGAGKSTLLKILSRITRPTTGWAEIHGRVGSLLEVGTGFHPELTGRENIFLNGAILGMKKAEIARRFDEIVAFAEVERFIDTPVKHYSSGMYVRLAFAVAAHLETEVLFVDEVLAVGDIEFQRKCLGRMSAVAKQGRTVIFVSHNLAAVRNLCTRCILVNNGRIGSDADVATAIACYLECLRSSADATGSVPEQIRAIPPDRQFRLISASLSQGDTDPELFVSHEPVAVELEYEILEPVSGLRVGFDLINTEESILFRTWEDDDPTLPLVPWTPGRYRSVGLIPANFLRPGMYLVSPVVGIYYVRSVLDSLAVKIPFSIKNMVGVGSHYTSDQRPGTLMLQMAWEREYFESKDGFETGAAGQAEV